MPFAYYQCNDEILRTYHILRIKKKDLDLLEISKMNVGFVLQHINLCRLFNALYIYIKYI